MKQLWKVFIFIFFAGACSKYQFDDVRLVPWEPEFAVPLVNSVFTVDDILEYGDTSSLIIDSTGTLALTYKGEIFSFTVDEILNVDESEFNNVISYPNPGIPFPFEDTLYDAEVFGLNFDSDEFQNLEVHHLSMTAGNLNLIIDSDLAFEADVLVTMPHALKDGIPWSHEVEIVPGITSNETFDLSGYTFDLTQEDQGFNQLRIDYRAIIRYDPNVPAGTDELSITTQFTDVELDFVDGYFGQNTLAFDQDTINIDFMDATIDGQFQFLDPYLKIITANSFGFPAEIEILEFKSINLDDQTETDIYLEGITDAPFTVPFPTTPGDSVIQQYEFNEDNSNIESILNDGSKMVVWSLDATSNPEGPTADLNFIDGQSNLRVETDVVIPLKGYAWGWQFVDTAEYTIDESPDELQQLTLRLILENGFPVDAQIQVYITDSNYVVLDSLFVDETQILASGQINVNGIVIAPTKTITDIVVEKERIDHILQGKYILNHARMETTNGAPPVNQVIEIKDDYTMGVAIGVKAKVLIDPEN